MLRLTTGKQPQLPVIQRVKSLTDITTVPSVTFSIPHKSSSSLPTSTLTTGNTTPSSRSISSGTVSSMTPSTSSPQPNPVGLQSTTYMTQSTKTPAGMPAWGEKGSPPKFRGSYEDVKRFLQRYNEVTSIYNLSLAQKCDKVTDYCSHKVKRLIESLKSYTNKDWDQLEKDFLKYYDADRQETRYIIRDLTQLTKKWKQRTIKTLTRWKRYERKFMTIAGWLVEKKKINDDEKSAYFWHGINRSLRRDIENRLLMRNPQPPVTVPYDMDDVNEVVQQLFERDRFEYNLADSDSDLPDSEDLSSDSSSEDTDSSDSEWEGGRMSNRYKHSRYKKKHGRRHSDSDSDDEHYKHRKTKSKKKTYPKKPSQKEVKKTSTTLPTSTSLASSKNSGQADVEQLIKQMGKLSINDPQYGLLYYKAMKIDPGVAQCVAAPKVQGLINTSRNVNATFPNSIPLTNNNNNQSTFMSRPPITCYGCGQTGHGLRTCEAIQEMINNGSIVRDQFGRITFKDGTPVQREPGETIKQAATRRQTMHSHFIQVSDMTEYYQSEDEDCEVMAAERETKGINKARKLVFDGVAVPRPPWKGKENVPPQLSPSQESKNKPGPITRSQGSAPEPVAPQQIKAKAPEEFKSIPVDIRQPRRVQIQDVEMKDVQQKAPPKAKPLPRQSQVSNQVGEYQVVNNILNTPVTMRVGEVLAASKELSHQLTEMIKQKNAKPPVPTNQALIMTRDRGLLIRIPLECGGRQVMGIIDTGSQLNVVSKEISDNIIKLPVNPNCEAIMRDANGGKGQLSGKVENVPLTCGAVETKATLFVGDNVPFDLLLGRPWQRSNLVSIDERPQGTYLVFRNPKHTEIVHELLVEQQVPKQEYYFDVSFDEDEALEEAEVGMITVSSKSTPKGTRNEEYGPARLRSRAEAPSSEPAAVKSEFKTQKNIENHRTSIKFPHNTYFYNSGTTPDLTSTVREKKQNFPTGVNQCSSQNQRVESDFQIWKSKRGHADSISTSVKILFWLTMVISYLRWSIVLLIKQVNSSMHVAYNFVRGIEHEIVITHNKQVQTMPMPASSPESMHSEREIPLINVSSIYQNSDSISFDNSDITPANFDHRINLIERVNEAHNASNARPKSTIISSPSTFRFSSQVHDGIQLEHGVLLNASMVFIDSEMEPLPMFRGNMFYQFFVHPSSPLMDRPTSSIPSTPPPSRNFDTPPSASNFEDSSSIFILRTLPSPEPLEEENSSEDGNSSGSEEYSGDSSASEESSDSPGSSANEHISQPDSSISKKFPNLVSARVCARKIPTADGEDVIKGPEHSPTPPFTSETTLMAASPRNIELYGHIRNDGADIDQISTDVVSDVSPLSGTSTAVYQVLAAVVDPLPPLEPPYHPHHRPTRVQRMYNHQSSIFSQKRTQADLPPFKPTGTALSGRDNIMESSGCSPTFGQGRGGNVQAGHSLQLTDGYSFPPRSDSKIRQEIQPGTAITVSDSNTSTEETDYSGETVNLSVETSMGLGLTSTSHDQILEPGISTLNTRDCHQPLSGLHLLAHAALIVEQLATATGGEGHPGQTGPAVFPTPPRTPPPNAVVNIQDGELIPFNTLSPLGELEYLQPPSQSHDLHEVITSGSHSTVSDSLQETLLESTPPVEPLPLRCLIHEELLSGSEASPSQKTPSISETKYVDGVIEPVQSLKRRRDETGELEETISNDGDISDHSPLTDELGRIKRPRSEASTSNASEKQTMNDAWEIAVTAALGAERSYSPTSSISTDMEAEWEEFQMELRQAMSSSSSFSQSSPPPLITVSEEEEEIQIFNIQNQPLENNAGPIASSPMVPATNMPTPIQPIYLPLDRQWYELKTDQPDVHGYSSASVYALRAHGYDIIPDLSSSEIPVPPGHPLWCLRNQYPILSMSTSKVYTGSDDNHPLVSWDNKLLPYTPNADPTHGKFHEMAIPFIQAYDILSTQRVCPEDWEGTPNTEYRREVRHRVWNAHMMQPGSHLFKNPFPAEPPHSLSQLHTFFGHQPIMLSHNYRTVADNPSTWKDRPIGAELNSGLALRFACPYANEYDMVAFNAWNPRIAKLREARAYILEGIKLIVSYLLNPRLRQLIDIYEDDLKHYFYHHCHLFRFIDPRKPPFMQGFTFECIHLDDCTIEYPPPPRKALPSRNPLLGEEEDEFLHHVSRIFENLGKVELTNAIRQVRGVIPFMAEEVRILFKAGYIDLLDQFDHHQVKYPLLWVAPELCL